jgi:phosphoadenosine phosphosulfate reductase
MIKREFPGHIALLTSFGADSGLLLAMVAEIEPSTPVLFLNTGKHFPETLTYAQALSTHLGLTDVRWLSPFPQLLLENDKDANSWQSQPKQCCYLRKTEPLNRAIETMGLLALITGRDASQKIELDENGVFRINPIAGLSREAQRREIKKRAIPPHPLEDRGYSLIGCEGCTLKVHSGLDPQGQWAQSVALEDEPKLEYDYSATVGTTDWSV